MIQTYEPSSPGMIVCISGGRYVETSAHLAAMEGKDVRIKTREAESDWWCRLAGERQQEIAEKYHIITVLNKQVDDLKADNIAWATKHFEEMAELKAKLSRLAGDYEKIIREVLLCNPISAWERDDDSLEPPWEVISRLRTKLSRLTEENEGLKAENEKVKGEAIAWEKSFNIEWERLERLTALINDDERAEGVVEKGDYGLWEKRRYALNDYRAMLKEAL